jgi:hypothetical protein
MGAYTNAAECRAVAGKVTGTGLLITTEIGDRLFAPALRNERIKIIILLMRSSRTNEQPFKN